MILYDEFGQRFELIRGSYQSPQIKSRYESDKYAIYFALGEEPRLCKDHKYTTGEYFFFYRKDDMKKDLVDDNVYWSDAGYCVPQLPLFSKDCKIEILPDTDEEYYDIFGQLWVHGDWRSYKFFPYLGLSGLQRIFVDGVMYERDEENNFIRRYRPDDIIPWDDVISKCKSGEARCCYMIKGDVNE